MAGDGGYFFVFLIVAAYARHREQQHPVRFGDGRRRESRMKSEATLLSLERRFSRGHFLTPCSVLTRPNSRTAAVSAVPKATVNAPVFSNFSVVLCLDGMSVIPPILLPRSGHSFSGAASKILQPLCPACFTWYSAVSASWKMSPCGFSRSENATPTLREVGGRSSLGCCSRSLM